MDESILSIEHSIFGTYIASLFEEARSPVDARGEFDIATGLTKPAFKTRYAFNIIRQAKSYFVERQYPIAMAYVEEALEVVKDIASAKTLARFEAL